MTDGLHSPLRVTLKASLNRKYPKRKTFGAIAGDCNRVRDELAELG